MQALQLQWVTSYDLHVLGMPPALILSQDQTLKKKLKNLHFFVDIRFWIWYIIYALSKKGVKMIFEN